MDVEFTKWSGVSMRRSGFIHTVNNSQFINRMIRKKTEPWASRLLPAKLRDFTEGLFEKVDNLYDNFNGVLT